MLPFVYVEAEDYAEDGGNGSDDEGRLFPDISERGNYFDWTQEYTSQRFMSIRRLHSTLT